MIRLAFNQDGTVNCTVNEGGLSKYEKLIMDVLSLNGSLGFEVQNEPQKGELQENIIKLIKDNPKITRKEMSIKLGKSINTIFRILKDNPYIKYVGSSKKMVIGK